MRRSDEADSRSADERSPVPVTVGLLRGWPLPAVGGTKHDRGQVLVVGGSAQTVGAVRLAGEAAMRVGAGKLQIANVSSRAAALAVAMPEALVRGIEETAEGHLGPAAADQLLDL